MKTYGGTAARAGTSAVAPGLLEVNWWLRKHTEEEKKIRWVGPVAGARFLEGDTEALRASLCWSEKEPLVFPPSVREMGSDPQGPPSPPLPGS